MMATNILQNRNNKYNSHYIKFVSFETIYYDIDLNVGLSYIFFLTNLYMFH